MLELVIFPPKHKVCFLKHLVGIISMGNQRMDVLKQRALRLG
ncbi:hypothetical protein RRSWK_00801 [Rhodopirellula sp. SWK7]|nr:hypothetical protein RRSWK_00801 [Rhodopirellula sp. SWK7]